jgi:NAD(P)-dependent dehydrogenase (short-subunit alcohol dehydrogenase family)
MPTYAAMKGGVEVLTRYLAKELGTRKVTVNVAAPYASESDFAGGVVRDNKEVNQFIASQTTGLGRAVGTQGTCFFPGEVLRRWFTVVVIAWPARYG